LEGLLARIISDLPEVIQYATEQLLYSTGRLLGGMGLKFNARHLMEYFPNCPLAHMSQNIVIQSKRTYTEERLVSVNRNILKKQIRGF
jgi:hypothetical protein